MNLYGTYGTDADDIYDLNSFKGIAAHEFGHALGLGDAYILNQEEWTYSLTYVDNMEVSEDDMMFHNIAVSANDIEMLLEAQKTWQVQEFITDSKSSVIRCPQEFLTIDEGKIQDTYRKINWFIAGLSE